MPAALVGDELWELIGPLLPGYGGVSATPTADGSTTARC
jgi:hypothetical protein